LERLMLSLAEKVLAGDTRAAARLITLLEDGSPEALAGLDALYSHTGKAHIVGITGAAGSGKSTLAASLTGCFRRQGKSVGIIAIDPTSALTGGAILGDRIRMQGHSCDDGVFIRSLATRGWAGGLARAALGAVCVMDAMGKDVVLVETVGSGQVELDIFRAADTTLAVVTPGAGDDIQMMKAGILEVVDIFVVNKADKEGADILKAGLEDMLRAAERHKDEWLPPVILTEAVADRGTEALAGVVTGHRDYLAATGGIEHRRRERTRLEILENLAGITGDAVNEIKTNAAFDKMVAGVLESGASPRRAAAELVAVLAANLSRRKNS
jgi:LAO/AO transport system kinase